jgi:hypothetical protein
MLSDQGGKVAALPGPGQGALARGKGRLGPLILNPGPWEAVLRSLASPQCPWPCSHLAALGLETFVIIINDIQIYLAICLIIMFTYQKAKNVIFH